MAKSGFSSLNNRGLHRKEKKRTLGIKDIEITGEATVDGRTL